MSNWAAIILIFSANLLTGWLVLRAIGGLDGDWLARLMASAAVGTVVNGWLALVLAELGWFSLGRVTAVWLLLLLVIGNPYAVIRQRFSGFGIPSRRHPITLSPRHLVTFSSHHLLLLLWLPAAIWLFFRPHEFIIGGADAGVYVSLSAEIAQHGSIRIQDDVLAGLDPDLYPALLRPVSNPEAPFYLLPAFFVTGEPAGQITPQFYPLHPVWQAVAYGLGGIRAELLLTGLWALLGALAIYLTARDIAGEAAAMLALAGLSLNALQVWFARYPTTEMLTQFLFWAGLWALANWLDGRSPSTRAWALTAGLSFGATFLVRIDAAFVLPVLAGLALWLWLSPHRPAHGRYFWTPLLLLLAHSLVHALWQSRPYFFELFQFALRLGGQSMVWLAAAAVIGLAGLGTLWRWRDEGTRLVRWRQPFLAVQPFLTAQLFLAVAAVLVLLLGVYGWFVRPALGSTVAYFDPFSTQMIPAPNAENLVRLGWYLSPAGVWLGLAGVAWLVWRLNRRTAVTLAMGLLFALTYLWNIRANPHQIYASRRYVPAVTPLFVMGAAVLIGQVAARKSWWRVGAAALLTAVWLGGIGWNARGFVSQVDYGGMIDQLAAFNAQLEPESVLIFHDPAPVGVGDFWGTPLKFLHGQTVFTLRDPALADAGLLKRTMEGWQNDGRSVYWVGNTEWLRENGLSFATVGIYTLTANNMEASYTNKPQKVIKIEWRLELARLTP